MRWEEKRKEKRRKEKKKRRDTGAELVAARPRSLLGPLLVGSLRPLLAVGGGDLVLEVVAAHFLFPFALQGGAVDVVVHRFRLSTRTRER
jgi:hypothetical protein